MKRFIFFACLIIGISGIVIAQENKAVPRLSLGGGPFLFYSSDSISIGGSADFAFLIFHRNGWDMRNNIVFRGGSSSEGSIMMLSEKISLGGMVAAKWRSYGYVEGGIGFEKPLVFSFGGGGGTDIFFKRNSGIYFEAGGLFVNSDGELNNGGIFQIGWRGWF